MQRLSLRFGARIVLWLGVALIGAGADAEKQPPPVEPARRVSLGKEGTPTVSIWLETSLNRVFPNARPGTAALCVLAPRNGRVSFQACLRNDRIWPLRADCEVAGADDLRPLVRLVGLVPMPHFTPNTSPAERDGNDALPGLAPDPLYPATKALVGPSESRSYWITLRVPADARPGKRMLTVRLLLGDNKQAAELPVTVEVSPFIIQPRHDFPVIHWWRGEATWDYYHTGMFEDPRWWDITREQLRDMLDHGSDVLYVPIFFDRREIFKRPCQLLGVSEPSPGKYAFDWSQVKRLTDMGKALGFRRFEWSHLWIYWGVKNPVRVYEKVGGRYVLAWPADAPATGEVYVNFLRQFLPEFHAFLLREGILETSYFHLSDEPGSGEQVENYKRARQVLRELAPWMKVMDALSDIQYGRQGLTDMPIPMVNAAQAYIDAKIPHWVYYCCAPTGPWLNRFIDTPLPKIRMAGWLFYRLGAKGFLHWGFNYWHKMEQEKIGDPYTDASNGAWPGIPYGDPFEIYPGADGRPVDSIRWEVFAESLQDYAILQTAGVRRDDPMLGDLKSYADFPKSEQWIRAALERVLSAPR
jgi:hypothetical protein